MEKLNEAFIDISKVIWNDKNTSGVHFLASREYELMRDFGTGFLGTKGLKEL